MNPISTILLVPNAEHAEALLREGPCGYCPPMMGRVYSGHTSELFGPPLADWYSYGATLQFEDYTCQEIEGEALVLAYNGKPFREGIDRAQVVRSNMRDGGIAQNVEWALDSSDADCCITEACRSLGTIVFLDSQNKEIVPGTRKEGGS